MEKTLKLIGLAALIMFVFATEPVKADSVSLHSGLVSIEVMKKGNTDRTCSVTLNGRFYSSEPVYGTIQGGYGNMTSIGVTNMDAKGNIFEPISETITCCINNYCVNELLIVDNNYYSAICLFQENQRGMDCFRP